MTHFSTSMTHFPVVLYYHGSYKRNIDNTESLTLWKYRQFLQHPKNKHKPKKKNCNVTPTNLLFLTTYRLTFLVSQLIMGFFI